jgi:predicted PurR-regulated permease PerM
MRLSPKLQRFLILGLSGPIVALNIWLMSQVFRYFEQLITLLTIAAVLAFLLNYAVRFLERIRIPRNYAVMGVLLITLTLLTIVGLTLVPAVVDQIAQLLNKLPEWLQTSQQNLEAIDTWARARRLPLDLTGFSVRMNIGIERQIQALAPQALWLALGTVNGVLNAFLVLVMAFYMLVDGDRLWYGLINLLPNQSGILLSESLRLNFHNFFISQILLGVFMFGVLTPIFLFLQVPFALLFALLIGVSQLIPLIGATLAIGLVTLLIMFQNIWLAMWAGFLAVVVQQIKDNLLAPKLMGNFTGLNPLWIFIALLMGLQIAGFLGVLVAVPIAGTLKTMMDAVRGKQVFASEIDVRRSGE